MIREMLILGVTILVFAGIVLTYWVYRSILSPLNKLQEATKKIRDGNLEFTLDVDADDEIGQLCQDFEEMRIRLKENAEDKIQYDKDNKELISNISHDLKTPITAIKGYVEGILDGVASSPEKLDKYIRTIYNKSNDMDRLIDELTFYSKLIQIRFPIPSARSTWPSISGTAWRRLAWIWKPGGLSWDISIMWMKTWSSLPMQSR